MRDLEESSDISAKLTEWVNEPSLLDLKSEFDSAKTYHDEQMFKITKWNDLLSIEGKSKVNSKAGRSSVQPKLIRRQAEWRYSALTEPFLGTPKLFKISPVTFEDTQAAKQNEKVLNYQFRTKLNRVKFIDDFVRSTVDEGTSITQLGWERTVVMEKKKVPVWTYYSVETQEELDALEQSMMMSLDDPRTFDEETPEDVKEAVKYYTETQQPVKAVQTDETEVEVEKVLVNKPTVRIHNPKNVYIDPTCEGDLDKALFVTVSFETSHADLLKEKDRYKNLDKVVWDNNGPINDTNHTTQTPNTFNFKGMRKKVVAYEYWGFYDIKDDGVLVPIVATWIGNVMIRMEENPFPDQNLPFVVVPYLPIKRNLYGETDAELLEDNQNILGAVTRGMIDLLGRSANSQQGIAKGMLDPLNRKRFDSGDDYEFNPNISPNAGLIQHKYPELPQSALTMVGLQNQEAEALTGVKSFGGGISGESYGQVAAGVRGALDAASKREMAILRRLAKGMSQIGVKISAMNSVWLSEEETIRITNTEFEIIKREDLAGQYDIEVDISTAEVDAAKSEDLSFMLQTMGNSMDFGMTKLLLAEIAELKRMPELAHKITAFEPQPDPMQQKMQELALAEMEAKVSKVKAEAELAIARATDYKAESAKTMVETEQLSSGVSHERAMEHIRSQAEGNRDTEVTKAILKGKKENEEAPNIEAAVGFNEITRNNPEDSLAPQPVPIDFQPQINENELIEPQMDPNMTNIDPNTGEIINQPLPL